MSSSPRYRILNGFSLYEYFKLSTSLKNVIGKMGAEKNSWLSKSKAEILKLYIDSSLFELLMSAKVRVTSRNTILLEILYSISREWKREVSNPF